jgi:hypothetical protein
MAETLTSTPALPPPGLTRPQRRYTDDEIAEALSVLAETHGDAREAARITDIPESTIRAWADGKHRAITQELALAKRVQRAAAWDALQEAGVAQALAQLPNANARDAAVVAGIAVDKAALLRGEPGQVSTVLHVSISLTASDVAAARSLLAEQLTTLTEVPNPQPLTTSDSQE